LRDTQKIYLLTSDEIDLGIESTVAGVDPNDYSMESYAKVYAKFIGKLLH
jgi:hypothetical protein